MRHNAYPPPAAKNYEYRIDCVQCLTSRIPLARILTAEFGCIYLHYFPSCNDNKSLTNHIYWCIPQAPSERQIELCRYRRENSASICSQPYNCSCTPVIESSSAGLIGQLASAALYFSGLHLLHFSISLSGWVLASMAKSKQLTAAVCPLPIAILLLNETSPSSQLGLPLRAKIMALSASPNYGSTSS